MAGKVVKFVVKSAVAGSLIYVTLRVTNSPWIAPRHLARNTESRDYMATPSNTQEASTPSEMFKETWNKGAKKFFNGMHEAPGALKELSVKTMTQIKESYKNNSK